MLLKGDSFSQPPPVEVTPQLKAKVETIHKQTQELRTNHQKVNACLSSLLARVLESEAWATETNLEFKKLVAQVDQIEE